MLVEHKIVLDLARGMKADTITVSKGDTDSRKITLLLFVDGEPMDLDDVTAARVNVSMNDSAEVTIDATVDAENHMAYFVLPADLTTTAGKRSYTLTLTTASAQITTPEWYINVMSQMRDDTDTITAEDLAGFQETLARIQEMLEAAQQTTDRLPNPYALSIVMGNTTYIYDGSAAVTVNLIDGNSISY